MMQVQWVLIHGFGDAFLVIRDDAAEPFVVNILAESGVAVIAFVDVAVVAIVATVAVVVEAVADATGAELVVLDSC